MPMRVLHVISAIDPVAGGTATAVNGMAVAQAEAGIDVSLLSTHREAPGHETADNLRRRGVKVTLLPGTGALSRHPRLRQITDEHVHAADVVHVHALFEEVQHLASRAAQRAGKPYFVSPHGMLCPWSYGRGKLKKNLYMLWRLRRNLNRATAIHYTSEMERDLTARLGLRPPPVIVPIGLDRAEFQQLPPRGTFRSRYPQLQGRPTVLFLSRLSEQKGLDVLIPAFAQGAPEQAMLVIAGPDFGTMDLARQLVTRHGIESRVIFTGMLKGADRIAAMTDADVFALSSRHENFGIVVIESLAAGVPVLISDQVYIHSFITRARVGEVAPLDVNAFAQMLRRWLTDDALRRDAAGRARPFVFEHFDWPHIARQWSDIYHRSTAGSSVAVVPSPQPQI